MLLRGLARDETMGNGPRTGWVGRPWNCYVPPCLEGVQAWLRNQHEHVEFACAWEDFLSPLNSLGAIRYGFPSPAAIFFCLPCWKRPLDLPEVQDKRTGVAVM